MSIIFLAIFWTGCILLASKTHESLLTRAKFYAGRGVELVKKSRTADGFKRWSESGKRKLMRRELAEALSYIRNLVILGRGESMSGELLMEELSELTELLSPAFADMAHSLHVNDRRRASSALARLMRESLAADVGAFLAGWEDIEPEELLSSLEAYRSALRDARETELRKRDEMLSDLIYFPVVANAMAVLLNFIYVGYFIEQREALSILF